MNFFQNNNSKGSSLARLLSLISAKSLCSFYKTCYRTINYTYTDQNDKRNTFVSPPIFHELNSKIKDFFYVHKRPILT